MTGPHILDITESDANRISRRTLFGFGAATVLGAGGIAAIGGSRIFAQEESETPGGNAAACATPGASPEASPVASPAASPEASPAADACAPADGYVVHAVDIAFEPTELTIPADTDVTVTIENHGVLEHDFNIDDLDVHSDLLAGGESTTVTINALAGEYEYYCSVVGHKEAGMVGTLIVE